MKNCVYTIILNGKSIKLDSEVALDNFLLSNFDEYLKMVGNKPLFSFDKSNLDVLETVRDQSIEVFSKAKEAGLKEYFGLEHESYDGGTSVLEWIGKVKLESGFSTEDYILNTTSNLKKQNPDYTEEEIKNIINHNLAVWQYTRKLGKGLHYITQKVLDYKGKLNLKDDTQLLTFIGNVKNSLSTAVTNNHKQETSINGISDEILLGFVKSIISFKIKLLSSGNVEKIYTEFPIIGEVDPKTNLMGKLDVVVVRKNGSVEIYDLKISNEDFGKWDVEKKRIAILQQEIYKRLLIKQGINPSAITYKLLPFKVNVDTSKINALEDDYEITDNTNTVTSIVADSEKSVLMSIEQKNKLDNAFPIITSNEFNSTPILDAVSNNLSKYFPVDVLNNNKFLNLEAWDLKKNCKVNSEGKWVFWDQRLGHNVYFDTEEKLNEYIEVFIHSGNDLLAEKVNAITKNISEVLESISYSKNPQYFPTSYNFPNINNAAHKNYINSIFSKYLYQKGWQVIYNEDLVNLGVIMLVNNINKTIDLVSITDMDPTKEVNLKNGKYLLSNFFKTPQLETDKNRLPASKGNIEMIKLLEVASEILSKDYKEYIIDTLMVSNIDAKISIINTNQNKLFANYNLLRSQVGLNDSNLIQIDPLKRFSNTYQNILSSLVENAPLTNKIKDKFKFAGYNVTELDSEQRQQVLDQLYSLLRTMRDEYFYPRQNESGRKVDTFAPDNSLESSLYVEIARTIMQLTGVEVDPYNDPKLAEWFGDIFKQGDLNRYFLNSTKLNTSDTIKMIEPIKNLLEKTRYNIRNEYYNYKTKNRKLYRDFKDSGKIRSNKFINMSEYDYKELFDTSEYGKKYFLLKDPEKDTTLNPAQKEFLTKYLQDINNLRFPGISEETLRSKGQWLMAGIMKASVGSRIANNSNIINAAASTVTDDLINRKQIVEENDIKAYNQLGDDTILDMYNIFESSNTMESREKLVNRMVEQHKSGDIMQMFETNLERIADSMHLAYIRQKNYNKILPIVQANLTILRLASFASTGQNIGRTIDFITNHIKTTVFDESLIEDENKQLYTIAAHAKSWASKMILGFNTKSGIKETAVSFFTLYTRAVASSLTDEHKIGLKDMSSAYSTVWKDAMEQIGTLTKLESLNMFYGISNMSEDEIVSRMNYYQGDPLRFEGNMFWTSRAPDYLNRMTILVGYMKKYGCYDAYELDEDGLLKYDWKKDKRFNLLANYNDRTVPESEKTEYQYQRSLYNTLLNKLIEQEYQIIDKQGNSRLLTKNDDLPQAFSREMRDMVKQEADTLFGYMDNDNKSDVFKSGMFTIIGHFKTYLTAKKNQWFLTRDTYAGGHFEHAKDVNGNLLYMHYDNDGRLLRINTEISENPYVDWKGSITEGIFWSLTDLFYNPARAIFNPDYKQKASDAWKDPVKRRNLMIALQEAMLYWLLGLIFKLMYDGVKTGELTPEQRTFIGISRDARNELNILKVLQGGTEFNAPSVDYFKNVGVDIVSAFNGELNPGRVLTKNIGMIKPFRPFLDIQLQNPKIEHSAISDLF